MLDILRKQISQYKKKKIALLELERMTADYVARYEEFADLVLALEEDQILTMVKKQGRTSRIPSLACHYRINKSLLLTAFHQELQQYHLLFDPHIHLDAYFSLDPAIWKEDLPFLKKINYYLASQPLPTEQVPAPERSFELVGDEKWITDQGGKAVLERISLWDQLQVVPVSDPLMFAVNPTTIQNEQQFHLIVENKTTYQGLLQVLLETDFSTLIFGSGFKIVKSIEQFTDQYPVKAEHFFFYFGDLDRSGISIWYSLQKQEQVKPALPFYLACLAKESALGKEYQRENKEALAEFLVYFDQNKQEMMLDQLEQGKYYPQEILKTTELQRIWRETDWRAWM